MLLPCLHRPIIQENPTKTEGRILHIQLNKNLSTVLKLSSLISPYVPDLGAHQIPGLKRDLLRLWGNYACILRARVASGGAVIVSDGTEYNY